MSAALDFNTDEEWEKLLMRWTVAGHEVIPERATFRHKAYKKDLPADTKITLEDEALFMTSAGRPLLFGDVLPERADLCINEDGKLLPQHLFEQRYFEFLNWFPLIEGSDPKAEPIPNVAKYITQVPDRFSESMGMVDAHFDATIPAPEEQTHKYDPENDKLIEIVREQGEASAATLEAVRILLEKEQARSDKPSEPPKRGPGRPRKDEGLAS